MPNRAPSPRTEIRRKPQRGHYDRATIDAIVDAALICHVAFSHGAPALSSRTRPARVPYRPSGRPGSPSEGGPAQ